MAFVDRIYKIFQDQQDIPEENYEPLQRYLSE